MGTKYTDIFEIVLSLMKSYEIDSIYDSASEEGVTAFFIPYLKIASGELEITNCEIDLSNRDDTTREFNTVLTDGQQLIVAKLVFSGYLSKETHDILQMKLHLQDGDFKTFAEKNNLEAKMNALYTLKEEIEYNIKRLGYNKFSW